MNAQTLLAQKSTITVSDLTKAGITLIDAKAQLQALVDNGIAEKVTKNKKVSFVLIETPATVDVAIIVSKLRKSHVRSIAALVTRTGLSKDDLRRGINAGIAAGLISKPFKSEKFRLAQAQA